MTTQEMIDYLTAQVKELPELTDREVVGWSESAGEYQEMYARQVWFSSEKRSLSYTPYEDYETRIEIQ